MLRTAVLFLWCSLAWILGSNPVQGADSSRPLVPGFERFYSSDKADLARGGRLLVSELGCTACHASDSWGRRQAPILDTVGSRMRVSAIRKFLSDPQAAKPGTLMPDLLRDDPEKGQKIEALVHLLASTGTLKHERPASRGISQGRDLYHKVGCVACHGTRKGNGEPDVVLPTSVPMSDLKTKYSISSLAAFLENPLHARPSGRMPRLLKGAEARAVATYLLQGIQVPLVGKGTVRFAYYEGDWDRLPDFSRLKAKEVGRASGFDIGVAQRENNYALKFDGLWHVDREALYTFLLSSDDGSRLYVDGKLLVDNDGTHATMTKTAKLQLARGWHEISVTFFQAGGEATLEVQVQATGFGKKSLGELVVASKEDLDRKPRSTGPEEDLLVADPTRIAQGKELFATLGCANCHQLKIEGKPVESRRSAPKLAMLAGDKGCLADSPGKGIPRFALEGTQRLAIRKGLQSKPPERTPETVVVDAMTTLNCYACHLRDKRGGPEEGLNKYFLSTQPEMGDEGRLPPPLDGVGAKLNPDYFKQLLEQGADDRPYMHTRMPGFGLGNLPGFVEAVQALDKLPAVPAVTFNEPMHRVKSQARHLIGGMALGCIKCHTFNGVKAEGVQGIDMTLMPRRLKREWFHAYIADPARIRPGTRMPASFLDGKSVLPDVLDGTARTQIEAMWDYLRDGSKARLPVGMGKQSIPLVPVDSAIVYRNFIEGAGPRAIGVGYPEKAHLAFDANEGRIALLWQGAFLDAARHWTDRGVGFEGPLGDNVLKLPPGISFALLNRADASWPRESPKQLGYRFRGYRLTRDDRPTFLYSFGSIQVEDFPNPAPRGKEVSLKRTFQLATTKPIEHFYYRAAVGSKIEPIEEGWYRIDGAWKMKLSAPAQIRKMGDQAELIVPIRFKDNKAELIQEYAW